MITYTFATMRKATQKEPQGQVLANIHYVSLIGDFPRLSVRMSVVIWNIFRQFFFS